MVIPYNIGDLPIDPDAEQSGTAEFPADSSDKANGEYRFFKEGGEEYKAFVANLQHKTTTNQQNLGILGKFFGDESHAPIYIAGIFLLLCLGALLISYYCPPQSPSDLTTLHSGLLALIGAILGYLLGKK